MSRVTGRQASFSAPKWAANRCDAGRADGVRRTGRTGKRKRRRIPVAFALWRGGLEGQECCEREREPLVGFEPTTAWGQTGGGCSIFLSGNSLQESLERIHR